MWSIHDDIRDGWKDVLAGVKKENDLTPDIDKKTWQVISDGLSHGP